MYFPTLSITAWFLSLKISAQLLVPNVSTGNYAHLSELQSSPRMLTKASISPQATRMRPDKRAEDMNKSLRIVVKPHAENTTTIPQQTYDITVNDESTPEATTFVQTVPVTVTSTATTTTTTTNAEKQPESVTSSASTHTHSSASLPASPSLPNKSLNPSKVMKTNTAWLSWYTGTYTDETLKKKGLAEIGPYIAADIGVCNLGSCDHWPLRQPCQLGSCNGAQGRICGTVKSPRGPEDVGFEVVCPVGPWDHEYTGCPRSYPRCWKYIGKHYPGSAPDDNLG